MMNGYHQPYIQAAIDGEVSRLASAEIGERNRTLFKATAALASLGLGEGEILRNLKPAAESIGLRGSELYSTVKSGVKAGRQSPRDVPDPFKKALKGVMPSPKVSVGLPRRSSPGDDGQQPKFCVGTEDGPSVSSEEERRHVYTLEEHGIYGERAAMIRNGLYAISTKLLDGVHGGQTGVSVLRDGRMLGGGAVLYHFGSYHCSGSKWQGEVTSQEHTPTIDVRRFAGYIASMGFTGTYTDEGAEFEATALVGKRSRRQSFGC